MRGSGVQLVSLDDGSVVFSKDADALMNPASNVKLVTAAAALAKLGPEYRFDTEFLVEPGPTDRVRALYVRGKGDPSLTTERLHAIASELVHLGLREVGDLVLDDTWFDAERLAPGFEQEVSDRAYTAPTGALSLNANAVGVYLRAAAPGARAVVELEPPSDYFEVVNAAVGASSRARRASVSSPWTGTQQRITVRGTVPVAGEWAVWKRIDNPPMYFGFTFKRVLEMHGIHVRGKPKLGAVPERARLLYVAQSETFDLDPQADEQVLEQLRGRAAAEDARRRAEGAARQHRQRRLGRRGVPRARGRHPPRLVHPPERLGPQRHQPIHPAAAGAAAPVMWDRFPLAPEYLSSVGIAGKDGTLRYRFEGSEAVGRLRAKTGTLENVSALSGYVQSVGGERFAFSVMVNDYPGRSGPGGAGNRRDGRSRRGGGSAGRTGPCGRHPHAARRG